MLSRRSRTLSLVLAVCLATTSCGLFRGEATGSEETVPSLPGNNVIEGGNLAVSNDANAPAISLKATPAPARGAAAPLTEVLGVELTEAEVAAAKANLPPWNPPVAGVEFNRPTSSLRPPATGVVDGPSFGSPETGAPTVEPDDLEILRVQPEGSVDLAPFISISFNQPMVPLGTLRQLDEIEVPVTIEPPLEGRWEWLGTKVLRFQHDPAGIDRLPMATEFVVTVSAAMTSANGASLGKTNTFTFTTPPPSVTGVHPQHDHLSPTQIYRVRFSSPVDPAAIAAISFIEARDTRFETRVATEQEISESGLIGAASEPQPDVVYLRAVDRLPLDTAVTLNVGPNVPSVEGPRTNPDIHRTQGSTYGPLKIQRSDCGRCTPGSSLNVELNNPLDTGVTTPEMISVSPAIEGLQVDINGRFVRLSGATAPSTEYEVTLSPEVTDIYGQRLGQATSRTLTIGEADPRLFRLAEVSTADPFSENPSLEVFTTNHDELRVRMWAVEPDQFESYRRWSRDRFGNLDQPTEPPGTLRVDTTVGTGAVENVPGSTVVDLSDAIEGQFGHVVVQIDPVGNLAQLGRDNQLWWQNQPAVSWVQVTRIGLDSIADDNSVHVWTSDLVSGEPLGNVEISSSGGGATVRTDSNGLATGSWGRIDQLTATRGDDVALLTDVGWRSSNRSPQARWYVLDDRGVYRPGETASIKGWLRVSDDDAQLKLVDQTTIGWTANDAFGVELGKGSVDLSAEGGFDLTIDLPSGTNLGNAWVQLSAPGTGSHTHTFDVQEFRRPEFEVSTQVLTSEPIVAGDTLEVLAEASYFSGGALPDAPIRWEVRSRPATYNPPGWSDYSFSTRVIDWWFFDGGRSGFDSGASFGPGPFEPETEFAELSDVLNAEGRHSLQVELDGVGSSSVTLTSEAAVTDVNGQRWPATNDVVVHPSDRYVGIKTVASYGRRGEDAPVQVIVTSIDGEAQADIPVTLTMGRLIWQRVDGQFEEVLTDTATCEVTSALEAETCAFTPNVAGRYRIQASVTDEAGRTHESALTYWVSGGPAAGAQRVTLDQAQVIPDAQVYQPGSTAELLVVSPFASAHGQVIVTRDGIRSIEPITIENYSTTIQIEIDEPAVPNLDVQVELVGATPRTDRLGNELAGAPDRPAFASGSTRLRVSPENRRLQVEARPAAAEVVPGTETTIDLQITDSDGDPVADVEAAVIVVDEAVLAVSQYEVADPIETFYQPLATWLQVRRGRSGILLANLEQFGDERDGESSDAMEEAAMADSAVVPAAAGGGDFMFSTRMAAKAGEPVQVRSNFDALAAFRPDVVTDSEGRATISVDLPDSLTRYRVVVVVANDDTQFGTGESSITATLPLTVRPATPRFANFGDEFRFGAIIQNTTASDITASVVVDTGNLTVEGTVGRRVTVPANNRVLVPFDAKADLAGVAHYRVAVVSDGPADAAQASFPVYTPATSEAFATYGEIDSGAIRIPILQPQNVYPQFGGLEVQTSSTVLQSLTDAVLYLDEYEYDSADRYSSRILGLLALSDVLAEFEVEGLQSRAEIDRAIERDIKALLQLQLPGEGVFRPYSSARQASPYQSVLATHALVMADQAGYAVNPDALRQAIDVMNWIEQYQFGDWSPRVSLGLQAYATHVLHLAGQPNRDKASSVMDQLLEVEGTAVDSLALLWPTLSSDSSRNDEIQRRIRNAAVDQAGTVTFATGYTQDDYYLYPSSMKSDAIVVAALLAEDPSSDLIAKAVRGINAGRTNGRWTNVQENAFVLIALRSYFDTFESVDPDFVARTWLGDVLATEGQFSSRSTDILASKVPMSTVIETTEGPDSSVVISKDGDGRLYYRLGLTYAPTDLTADPLDRGFVVSRKYTVATDEGSVERNEAGEWVIESGTTVKVEVTMVADARRTHVALVDPLAAGLEPRSPVFRDPIANDAAVRWWWWNWYEHTNLRDDRAEAFTSFLGAGTYTFSYLVEAVTPGTYVVPPAKAEEVYAPETFGRSGSDVVVVVNG